MTDIEKHIDTEALNDPEDHRASLSVYPAADDDGYVFVHRTTEGHELYKLSNEEGGHVLTAASRAFRQACNSRGIQ